MARAKATGDCYQAAYLVLMDAIGSPDLDELVLVHGTVTGTGPVRGKRFGHAWIERPDGPGGMPWVLDRSNGKHVQMPAHVYYTIGHIDPDETIRYGWRDAFTMGLRYEHYGPWREGPSS